MPTMGSSTSKQAAYHASAKLEHCLHPLPSSTTTFIKIGDPLPSPLSPETRPQPVCQFERKWDQPLLLESLQQTRSASSSTLWRLTTPVERCFDLIPRSSRPLEALARSVGIVPTERTERELAGPHPQHELNEHQSSRSLAMPGVQQLHHDTPTSAVHVT